jgi:hypothetical protein
MEVLKQITVDDLRPKQLIKPLKVEELLESERVLEALCETRDACRTNSGVGNNDDILF